MLYSMTGYGRAEKTIGDKTFLIELKSLNGKQFELRLMLPSLLKPFEFNIRNYLSEHLLRGTIECVISIKQNGSNKPVTINTDLLKAYYTSITEVAKELKADTNQLISAILRLPDIVVNSTEMMEEKEWNEFATLLETVVAQLNEHRKEEGKSIETDLLQRLNNIEKLKEEIKKLEPLRRVKIKEGLQKVLSEHVGTENYDPNRLEQELIYYIEKIDISEEQVRLTNHCQYFKTILNEDGKSKGKKLSFILQEFGREINTTGSKAYNTEIQQNVVQMKDELEKMKEQILNAL
ncbi:MAG: YicC family protein [Chitinophagaceae bacterium]|nr:YicC family protein [Chitinophagaceae bacterium]MCW5904126.1 YicC family protein [Chitinophagaceae bacterium]